MLREFNQNPGKLTALLRESAQTFQLSENDRFDFLFVNAGRAGSLALQNFLAMHPDIVVVPRNGLDDAIAGKISLATLHEEFLPLIRHCHSVGKKVVLVVRSVQPLWDREEVLLELSKRAVKCIMVVRNPREYLVSGYNVYVSTHFGYQFAQLPGVPWWNGGDESQILDLPFNHHHQKVIMKPSYPKNRLLEIQPFDINTLSEWGVFRYIHYYQLYLKLSRFFDNIQILDSTILDNADSIKKIFHSMGVDTKFTSPIYANIQHGVIQRYMRSNNVIARFFGRETILLRLSTTDDLLNDLDQSPPGPGAEFTEIATMPVTDEHRAMFPFKLQTEQISLSAHPWHVIPLYMRKFLEKSSELLHVLDFLFAQWIANISEIERTLEPYRVLELPAEIDAELNRIFNSDIKHLIALNPAELSHWK